MSLTPIVTLLTFLLATASAAISLPLPITGKVCTVLSSTFDVSCPPLSPSRWTSGCLK